MQEVGDLCVWVQMPDRAWPFDCQNPITGSWNIILSPRQQSNIYDQLHRINESYAFTTPDNLTLANYVSTISLTFKTEYEYDPDGNLTSLFRKNEIGEFSDNLTYNYDNVSRPNQLTHVDDSQPDPNQGVVDQSENNYIYDAIGNMVTDNQSQSNITWDVYGKVKKVAFTGGNNVDYLYDASGNRVAKKTNTSDNYYIRDASGNIMSIYRQESDGTTTQIEAPIYGSKRLGHHLLNRNLENPEFNPNFGTGQRSSKAFELSNHLGNVLAVVSDRKEGLDDDNDDISDAYNAEVIRAQDYYPFGMEMPGRQYVNTDFNNYRYGFNGKEKDESGEWGDLTHYDYGFRIYNPGIAKFLSVDPLTKKYPWYTPYQFAGNMPVWAIELDGLEPYKVTGNDGYEENDSSIEEEYIPTIQANTSQISFSVSDHFSKGKIAINRGDNQDSPYLYSLNNGMSGSGDQNTLTTYLTSLALDGNESVLAKRFMIHWKLGNGSTYNITDSEYEGLVRSYKISESASFAKNLSKIKNGQSRFVTFNVGVKPHKSGTIGDATMVHYGTLSLDNNGLWSFNGFSYLKDTYDFDLRNKESLKRWLKLNHENGRPFGNWLPTLAGKIANNAGKVFEVRGPIRKVSASQIKPIIKLPDFGFSGTN